MILDLEAVQLFYEQTNYQISFNLNYLKLRLPEHASFPSRNLLIELQRRYQAVTWDQLVHNISSLL